MIGRSIGNYKILEQLSRTENFGVYKAVDLLLNRSVVVKVLDRKVLSRPEVTEHFRSEAAALAKLEHKCVPALYSLTAIDDELFMISEYSEGETLDRILFREGNISVEKAVSIFAQIFECVEYAHKNNVAHGSLKTSDVLLTDKGNVKILGYGAAQTDDKENDISALALMLYESLTGKTEFDAEEKSEGKISETLESVIKKASSANSAEKFKNVAEFRAALVAAGFANAGDTENAPEKSVVKKPNGNKFSAIRAAKLSKRENRISPKQITLKPIQADDSKNKKSELSPKKAKQKNYKYKVAGAAMFAVLILHLVWQFSFVQSENVRDAETALKTIQPAAPPNETEISEPRVEPNVVSQPDEIKSDLKAKKSDVVSSEKAVQKANYGRSEAKPEPAPIKKKAVRESKNERLRRAEKLLTGM